MLNFSEQDLREASNIHAAIDAQAALIARIRTMPIPQSVVVFGENVYNTHDYVALTPESMHRIFIEALLVGAENEIATLRKRLSRLGIALIAPDKPKFMVIEGDDQEPITTRLPRRKPAQRQAAE